MLIEQIPIAKIALLPAAAPGFLPPHLGTDTTPGQLRLFTQCIIRNTAQTGARKDHFLIDGAPNCSVPDHSMKRELIVHGKGWGHLPDFLIADDLEAGRLVRVGGRHLPGKVEILAASRLRDRTHGPVAERLWDHIRSHSS